jgi:hypothetical protein
MSQEEKFFSIQLIFDPDGNYEVTQFILDEFNQQALENLRDHINSLIEIDNLTHKEI